MSYHNLDDLELLALIRENDEHAFSHIYERHWKPLYTTAYSIIGDQDFAKDAVQEVFISLWKRRSDTSIKNLKAYLQQATRFQVLKCIREQKVKKAFYQHLSEVTAEIIYENPLLFSEQQAFLLSVMNRLPDDCRLIFNLSREQQLTYKEIASRLNISEKTVEKKMTITLKLIREALAAGKLFPILCILQTFVT